MEQKYYRDLKHNYLVVEEPESCESKKDADYQMKVVEHSTIKGLLPCALRNINGERFYYYEINSMQTLRDRFAVGGMSFDKVKELLLAVKELTGELSEYLLGEEGIVFNEACIYTDLARGSYGFMYCPFYDGDKSFSDFALNLIELLDHEDDRASELLYRLCDVAAAPGMFAGDAIDIVLTEFGEEKEAAALQEAQAQPALQSVEGSFYEGAFEEDDEEEPDFRESALKRSGKKLGGKMEVLIALLFAAVTGAMVYIRMNYILSKEENMLSIAVMFVSVITGAVALACGLRDMKKNAGSSQVEADDYDLGEDDFTVAQPQTSEAFDSSFAGIDYHAPVRVTGEPKIEMPEMSETVVLDEDTREGLTLYSNNLERTIRIALSAFPLTVGKMEGCVDSVIGDKSISRLHCRFFEENGRIALMDLGSTNGTFRNGLKLTPREKVFIDEGDEIRMGRVCFDCR
ncbi:MAG: FHA domain-containing protein [Butyrivibrio sp.]|nr:FHA domain-containing protein [Butyrivibrio sp.]